MYASYSEQLYVLPHYKANTEMVCHWPDWNDQSSNVGMQPNFVNYPHSESETNTLQASLSLCPEIYCTYLKSTSDCSHKYQSLQSVFRTKPTCSFSTKHMSKASRTQGFFNSIRDQEIYDLFNRVSFPVLQIVQEKIFDTTAKKSVILCQTFNSSSEPLAIRLSR